MRSFLLLVFSCTVFCCVAQTGSDRRAPYRPSLGFLQYDGDSCFDITRREADRATKLRYWNEAIAYYRAARSCPDATQERRQAMYQRVQACRDSAEEELIRRERLAIAANRADDAEDLLHTFDRSLAYRLADFTHQYIVPPGEESGDVLQALYDTWYAGTGKATLPFCYQLQDNAGVDALYDNLGFFNRGDNLKTFAFSPQKHQLFTWEAGTMQPGVTYPIDTTMTECIASPDGHTLVFKSTDAFLLWRKPTETYRIALKPLPTKTCFNVSGDVFYYLNESEGKLYELRLNDLFQKGKYSRKRAEPMVFAQGLNLTELVDLAVRGNQLWLAYPDNITLQERNPTDKSTRTTRTIRFKPIRPLYAIGSIPDAHLYPESNLAIYSDNLNIFYLPIPATADTLEYMQTDGVTIAQASNGQLIATRSTVYEDGPAHLEIKNPQDSIVYQLTLQSLEGYQMLQGAFDADNRYFISSTSAGSLLVWELFSQPGTIRTTSANTATANLLSNDGQYIVTEKNGNLQVLAAENAAEPVFIRPAVPDKPIYPAAASAHWVAFQEGTDTLVVQHLSSNKKWFIKIEPPKNDWLACAFSGDEKRFAVATQSNQAVVLNLTSGEMRPYNTTEGQIRQIAFAALSPELILLEAAEMDAFGRSVPFVRIWNYEQPTRKPRLIALHDYYATKMALSPQGQRIALSAGSDVRIYNLKNLEEEDAHIRAFGVGRNQGEVVAMLFNAAEDALLVGYTLDNTRSNAVVVWDILTEQPRYRFAETGVDQSGVLTALTFTPDGQGLRSLYNNGTVLTRTLDVQTIRGQVQSEFRRLVAFSPDQIRAYNLDKALRYPGNFQKLTDSRDFPLIRSFFGYYREEALNSNNIERVADYCNRANTLYAQLDPTAQVALRSTILEMYEDYNWEYLQRNRPADALRVVNEMRRNFGTPPEALRAEATTSLLRNDLSGAAKQYTEWAIQTVESEEEDNVFEIQLEELSAKIIQLQQFDRLSASQTSCLCNLFGDFTSFSNICPEGRAAGTKSLVSDSDLRWDVFKRIYHSDAIIAIDPQIAELETALQEARTIAQRNKTAASTLLEKTILKLAEAYIRKAAFENGSPTAFTFYQKALTLLESPVAFSARREEIRVDERLLYRLQLGDLFLNANKLTEAGAQYAAALQEAEAFVKTFTGDNAEGRAERFKSDYMASLWQQTGMVRLFSGDASGAQTAFAQANELSFYGFDNRFAAHALLLVGNTREALDRYKTGNTNELVAAITYEIEVLGDYNPDRKAAFADIIKTVRAEAMQTYPETMDSNAIAYYTAAYRSNRALALSDWPAALRASAEELRQTEVLLARPNTGNEWRIAWINALLAKSYYLVINAKGNPALLDEAIRLSEKGEADALSDQPYFLTNHAHALLLRGDRPAAIALYKAFLATPATGNADHWDVLQKDFNDLVRVGVVFPDLPGVIAAIRPQ